MTRLPHPLVSVAELQRRLASGTPTTILDCRWVLGGESQRSAYEAGHLPGAAWVEFEEALTGTPGEAGRHPMPEAGDFQAAMRAAGVRNDRPVVVYDAGNSLAASRCWWLLRYFGKEDVQVLDGGLAAWTAAGGELVPAPPSDDADSDGTPARGDFVATPGHLQVLTADEAARTAEHHILLDARPADRFTGENEVIDPVAGHIPQAKSLPALSNIDDDGRFLPSDDLAMRFTARGIPAHERVGVYCGSGVQAMHLALALEVSGIAINPGVYVGSWSEWITDPERPIETGN